MPLSRARAAVGVAIVVIATPVAAAAQTLDDLDDAEDRVDEIETELDEATAAYEETWAEIELLREEIRQLEQRADRLDAQAQGAERRIGDRAREMFKRGSAVTLETLLGAEGPQAAVERAGMVAALQLRDHARVEEAAALRVALDQTRELTSAREAELQELQARQDEAAEVLQVQLVAAEEMAADVRGLVARQRRVHRGDQQGIYACIFDQGSFRFRDTWGAPRSGGRRHRGTDVFAPFRQPTYAFTSGVVERRSHSRLGGLGLYLRGDDGNVYYYAHLDAIASDGRVGNRVTAGEHIAYNGSTGNASRNAPHVHFEVHRGGGGAVNPYPWLAAACF